MDRTCWCELNCVDRRKNSLCYLGALNFIHSITPMFAVVRTNCMQDQVSVLCASKRVRRDDPLCSMVTQVDTEVVGRGKPNCLKRNSHPPGLSHRRWSPLSILICSHRYVL